MRDYMRIMENNQVDTGKLQIQVQSSVPGYRYPILEILHRR